MTWPLSRNNPQEKLTMTVSTIAADASSPGRVRDPLFRCLSDALRFAYLYSAQQYAQTPMSRLIGTSGLGTGCGLVGLDGAAQAGMIRATVDRLDPHKRAAIIARFADPHSTLWADAIYRLASWAVPAGVSHRRVRQALTAKHFGVKVHFCEVAEQCEVNRKIVSKTYNAMSKRLRELETAAQNALYDEFTERGLVE
ncbi:MAG: hypothetical protein RBS05_12430 [Zoogloea oleivorans]|uniref:hypothetical protein n=1 Tax=Zoogloea oleivorans TaxID=1552750 RepID=UPI002A36ED79|nr:hypothetical protein [Zoogloea oleivorans]MDY0036707.1 hypothetical protein [Zoogloea oleivorans]